MKFAVLGYGNLGRALASGLAGTGSLAPSDILICDSSGDALSQAQAEHYHVYPAGSINEMIAGADVICLAVKSYVFDEIVKSIGKQLLKDKLIVSFMAGVTIDKLAAQLEIAQLEIARPPETAGSTGSADSMPQIALAMPSLAIAKNEGIIAHTRLPSEVAGIFGKLGFAFEVPPEDIGKVTVFASCGLGFAAYLIDAFKQAGQKLGFTPETAARIAAQTFANACDSKDFKQTVKAVATPGGVTEQGIMYMDGSGVYKIISDAMQKAYAKVNQ